MPAAAIPWFFSLLPSSLMVTIAALSLPHFHGPTLEVELWLYAQATFTTADGKIVIEGKPGSGPVYARIAATITGTDTLLIDEVDVDPTTDASLNRDIAAYHAYLVNAKSGEPLALFASNISVPPAPGVTNWQTLIGAGALGAASTVTVAEGRIANWQFPDAVELRLYPASDFITVDGKIYLASTPGRGVNYVAVPTQVDDGELVIASRVLDVTNTTALGTCSYTLWFVKSVNELVMQLAGDIRIHPLPNPTTWADVIGIPIEYGFALYGISEYV